MDTPPLTVVVAAVIRDAEGRILLARRPPDRHMGGLWEFPGGKVRPDEIPTAALERELAEELGVDARAARPLTFAVHAEPDLRILLLFYAAHIEHGEPVGRDHQELRWVQPGELGALPMPPADAELVAALDRESVRDLG